MNYGLLKLKRGVLRFLTTTPLLIAVAFGVSGCVKRPPCKEPFTKTIVPIKVQDKQEIVFNIDDFDFLLDPNYVVEDMHLEGDVVLHHSRKADFAFSLNGTKTCRKDNDDVIQIDCGKKNVCDKDKNKDRTEKHRWCSKPHLFSLNGGQNIASYIKKIKLQKGRLKLKLHGRNHEISNVKLVVKGTHYVKCQPPTPQPSPTPTTKPVAPVSTIDSVNPNVSPTNATVKTINFSADQSGVTFFCSLDNAAAAPCSSPQNYADLGNGDHIFKVSAKNAAGLESAAASHSWTVDAVAPSVSIDNMDQLKSNTNSDSITFLFSSDDANSTYSCQLDNNPAAPCSSPHTYGGLSEGAHRFNVLSVDSVGNVSPAPASFAWSIDRTAPVTSIVSADPAAAVNNSTDMSVQFAANESASFECALDDGGYRSCESPHAFNGLSEGDHVINVRATDLVGNQGLPASYNWRTDLTAPVITIGNVVPNQGLTSGGQVSVEFTLSEMGNAFCSYDGAAAVACSSPFTHTEQNMGVHTLVISANDLSGNSAQSQSLSWDMDFLLPVVSFGAILPNATSYIASQNFSAEILPSKPMTMTARLNGQDLGPINSPLELLALPEGAYTLEVSGYDAVGNTANTIVHNFTVDVTAPSVTLSSQVNGATRFDSNVLTFESNDGSGLQCNVDQSGFGACVSPLALTGLAEGAHSASVRAVDQAGNVGEAQSVAWSVDTVAPLTTLLANQLSRDSFSFMLMSSEAGSFSCSLDGAPATPCSSPAVYANLAAGSHSFAAWATDAAGNVDPTGASFVMNIRPAISTALTNASPDGLLTNSRDMAFTFSANQADAHFQCSLDGAAPAACTSPLNYAGLNDGVHTFFVQAIDIFGNVDAVGASHSWEIDATAPVTSLTGTKLSANSFRADFASNEAGSVFTCQLDNGTAGTCVSPITFSGLAVGSHTFTVWAMDAAGNEDADGASYTLVVNPPINTTITSSTPNAQFTNVTSQAFTFTSNHADATFQCSLDGSPAATCSSPISYPEVSNGAHTFTVRAVDSFGNADPIGASYSWTVDTVAPTMATVNTVVTSTSITVNWTTSEPTTTKLFWGLGSNANNVVPEDSVYTTSHSVKLTGLAANTTYSLQPAGTDRAGNTFTATRFTARTAR